MCQRFRNFFPTSIFPENLAAETKKKEGGKTKRKETMSIAGTFFSSLSLPSSSAEKKDNLEMGLFLLTKKMMVHFSEGLSVFSSP